MDRRHVPKIQQTRRRRHRRLALRCAASRLMVQGRLDHRRLHCRSVHRGSFVLALVSHRTGGAGQAPVLSRFTRAPRQVHVRGEAPPQARGGSQKFHLNNYIRTLTLHVINLNFSCSIVQLISLNFIKTSVDKIEFLYIKLIIRIRSQVFTLQRLRFSFTVFGFRLQDL